MEVIKYPSPVLTRRNKLVTLEEAEKLGDILYKAYKGISCAGIAAPQIGINKRIFVARGTIFVNPNILNRQDSFTCHEGCLSIDRKGIKVPRFINIKVRYQDIHGCEWTETLSGYMAQVFQHEYDHLQGKLLVHREIVA